MAPVRCWQVDAFTDRPFGGNSAAVCWLEQPVPEAWMQSVAMEMNLAETAFVRRLEEGYELRWFTPEVEVDLCGHATLATAHALWSAGIAERGEPLRFHTRSGLLTARQEGEEDWIELDFPAVPAASAAPPEGLLEALEVAAPVFVGKSRYDLLVQLRSAEEVRVLKPDFRKLRKVPTRGVMVTARSDDPRYDFTSRFFAPAVGIDEDPVCGSMHCCLAPFWAQQLGKQEFLAYQASARGGVLRVRVCGDRIQLSGQAVLVWQGEIVAGP
jgi:PhzF family phenazine biosynthesis protein